jgi:hypothetical protein
MKNVISAAVLLALCLIPIAAVAASTGPTIPLHGSLQILQHSPMKCAKVKLPWMSHARPVCSETGKIRMVPIGAGRAGAVLAALDRHLGEANGTPVGQKTVYYCTLKIGEKAPVCDTKTVETPLH